MLNGDASEPDRRSISTASPASGHRSSVHHLVDSGRPLNSQRPSSDVRPPPLTSRSFARNGRFRTSPRRPRVPSTPFSSTPFSRRPFVAQLSYVGRIGRVARGAILALLFAVATVIVVGTGRDKVDPPAQSRSVTTVSLGRGPRATIRRLPPRRGRRWALSPGIGRSLPSQTTTQQPLAPFRLRSDQSPGTGP